jgi:hypothetical protein
LIGAGVAFVARRRDLGGGGGRRRTKGRRRAAAARERVEGGALPLNFRDEQPPLFLSAQLLVSLHKLNNKTHARLGSGRQRDKGERRRRPERRGRGERQATRGPEEEAREERARARGGARTKTSPCLRAPWNKPRRFTSCPCPCRPRQGRPPGRWPRTCRSRRGRRARPRRCPGRTMGTACAGAAPCPRRRPCSTKARGA